MKQLHADSKLNQTHLLFMKRRKPEYELYEVKADLYEGHNP